MSSMDFMEKLLDLSAEQAGGVEVSWKTLGEVAEIGTGSSNRQDENENGLYPFYVRSQTVLKSSTFQFDETSIIVPGEGGIGDIFHYTNGKYALHQRAYRIHVLSKNLNTKFLYYIMVGSFKQYILMKSVGATSISIRKPMLENFKIPTPCPENPEKSLEIQAEIVRILDAFTELTTELTARKKQYNYYRDQLLSFDLPAACLSGRQGRQEGEVEWKTLGEVGTILRGTAITEKETNPGEFPVVANGPSHNYYHDKSNRSGETIVIARSGAYAGLVSYWNQPIFLTDAFSIHPENKVLSTKFLYYFFKNDQTKIHLMSKGAGVPHVRANDFESYKIPIPPLKEQARITAILDRFDTLTHSISEGLPREIALRQKQYEHYRNLLLSFPRPVPETPLESAEK